MLYEFCKKLIRFGIPEWTQQLGHSPVCAWDSGHAKGGIDYPQGRSCQYSQFGLAEIERVVISRLENLWWKAFLCLVMFYVEHVSRIMFVEV